MGVIAELWVLKNAMVPIREGIETTPINYFSTNACWFIVHEA